MRKFLMLSVSALLLTLQLWAQRTITGRVTDEQGNPIANVSVQVKGTNSGTVTGTDGTYSLNVPANGRVLVFSAIGMGTQELTIGNQVTLNTSLRTEERSLQEVVVTGVGTATSKRKVAFSVETVSGKELPQVSQGISQALVGKVAGAQITSTSGQPGQQANIILRGINTINGGTQPMILVDGVQVLSNNLSNGSGTNVSSRLADLDLNNVERIEVVQGAAAATIYGAQGANGVIQIFTKKGRRDGRVRVNLSSTTSFDNVLRGNLELAQYHFFETDAQGFILNNSNTRLAPNRQTKVWPVPKQPASLVNAVNNKPFMEQTFDNIDAVFKDNALTTNHSVSLSGGREKLDFALTLSRLNQESIITGDYNKSNITLNLGFELFKNFNIRSISQVAYTRNTTGTITGQNNVLSPLGTALNQRQWINLLEKDSIGNYVATPTAGETSINPFYSEQFRNYDQKNVRLIQNFNVNYKPFNFLELDWKVGIDNYDDDFRNFIAYQLNTLTPTVGVGPTSGSVAYTNTDQTLTNSLISAYIRTDFEKDFKLNIPVNSTTQISYDYRKDRIRQLGSSGTGFSAFPPYTVSTAASRSSSESSSDFRTFGWLINQRFEYGNLFGVSGGVRVDYSSAFGRGSKPFTFPRGDAYFNVSELLTSRILKQLKLRGAYGEAGIQPGAYQRQVVLNTGSYGSAGYLATQLGAANPDLGVEVSKEVEAGTDVTLELGKQSFRNVRLSATWWKRKSEGVIQNLEQSPSTGVTSYVTNALSMKSDGIQLSLDADIFNKQNFGWDFGIRFGSSKSMVDKIANGAEIPFGGGGSGEFVLREGTSVGAFFGIRPLKNVDETTSKGVRYIPSANVGNYEIVNGYVVDKNTKQVVFTTEKEQIGDPNPDFNMSFINNITFLKNFTASFQVDWIYGNQIYNQTRQWMYRDFLHSDFDVPVTINGQTGAFVAYYNSLYRTNSTNAHFVEDGSFIRLRDLTLRYNFTDLIKNVKFLSNASISLTGRNLFTITDYSGMDPEASAAFNNPVRRGLDLYAFPNYRTFQVGVNLGF